VVLVVVEQVVLDLKETADLAEHMVMLVVLVVVMVVLAAAVPVVLVMMVPLVVVMVVLDFKYLQLTVIPQHQ
tara:strand:- start:72 stop:287 length:216 start_codon:yes stop_codon:yes gene_type:complete